MLPYPPGVAGRLIDAYIKFLVSLSCFRDAYAGVSLFRAILCPGSQRGIYFSDTLPPETVGGR